MPQPHGHFLEQGPARPMSAGFARALARRVYAGRSDISPELARHAEQLAKMVPEAPGRVHSLGAWTDEATRGALRASLPPELAGAMRPSFEWYGCRGAGFHTDAHYDAVLFGAWCLAGPDRDIVFGRTARRLPCGIGALLVFDPYEPHAVLDAGHAQYRRELYELAPASLYLAFELELQPPLRESFGIDEALAGLPAITSATPVNAETGALG
jgi:hypothetical protein